MWVRLICHYPPVECADPTQHTCFFSKGGGQVSSGGALGNNLISSASRLVYTINSSMFRTCLLDAMSTTSAAADC